MPASVRFSLSAIVAALLPAAARACNRISSSDVQSGDDDGGSVDFMIVIPRPASIQAQQKAEGNSGRARKPPVRAWQSLANQSLQPL